MEKLSLLENKSTKICRKQTRISLFALAFSLVALISGFALLFVSEAPFPSWGKFRWWWKHHGELHNICPLNRTTYTHPFLKVRPRLFQLLSDVIPDNSVVILPTAIRPIRDESDAEFTGWRQTANVLYVIGPFPVSGGAVALRKTKPGAFEIDLYLPELSQREVAFTGDLPSPEVLKKRHVVANVYSVSNMTRNIKGMKSFTTVPLDSLRHAIGAGVDLSEVSFSLDVREAFVSARFVKTQEELDLLEYATKVAKWVHGRMAKHINNAEIITENELAAEFSRLSGLCGGIAQAYGSIVGAGAHSAVLHYRTGEDVFTGNNPIPAGKLVLIDAAPEYFGYASDITRTFTRHGLWTKESAEVHGIVSRVQQKFIEEYYKEGASWLDINKEFVVDITKELWTNGFFVANNLDDLLKNNMYQVFMPHGLGHPVGLEVHDPTPLKVVSKSDFTAPAVPLAWEEGSNEHNSMFASYNVFRGHITTVEPGVYFIPGLLNIAKADPQKSKFINWKKLEAGNYVEMGGVRIEDVVMIDLQGKRRIL